MTSKGRNIGTLPYASVKRERPIPLWKYFVFAPLLFGVGVFIIAGLAAAGFALFGIVQEWLAHGGLIVPHCPFGR